MFIDASEELEELKERMQKREPVVNQVDPIAANTKILQQLLGAMTLSSSIPIEPLSSDVVNTTEWFKTYERLATAQGWTLEIKGAKLSAYLKDNALRVWSLLPDDDKNDYVIVKRANQSRLNDITPVNIQQKFFNRTQRDDENVQEYSLKLEQLLKEAFRQYHNMADVRASLKDRFATGLKKNITIMVSTHTFNDFEEAVAVALKAEKAINENKHLSK